MHRILVATLAFATCVQPLQADTKATSTIPSGAELVQSLVGKRTAPASGPGGRVDSFLEGGILKLEINGVPDQTLNWSVQDQSLCIKDGQEEFCFEVIQFNDREFTLRSSDTQHGNQTRTMLFLNEDGVPLRDVVEYDDVLARSLLGRVITVEEVNPPKSLKGSKTVLDFNSKKTVALTVLNASGQPALGGVMAADLPYNSKGDTLCLINDEHKNRCMHVEISGDTVRLVPIKKGALVENETMIGTIE